MKTIDKNSSLIDDINKRGWVKSKDSTKETKWVKAGKTISVREKGNKWIVSYENSFGNKTTSEEREIENIEKLEEILEELFR